MGTTRKPVVLTMSALGAIALLSVGFASWEIRNTAISTTPQGSISADVVYDKRLKIEGGTWDPNTIVFGYNSSISGSNYDWLTNTNEGNTECLTAKYSFQTLCPKDKTAKCEVVADSFKATDSDGTTVSSAWSTAKNGNYVSDPKFDAQIGTRGSTEDTNGKVTYSSSVTVTFGWGTAFGGKNPYEYYNASSYDDALASSALTALDAIYKLNGVTFSFTITVSIADTAD